MRIEAMLREYQALIAQLQGPCNAHVASQLLCVYHICVCESAVTHLYTTLILQRGGIVCMLLHSVILASGTET